MVYFDSIAKFIMQTYLVFEKKVWDNDFYEKIEIVPSFDKQKNMIENYINKKVKDLENIINIM